MDAIARNWEEVKARVAAATERAGRGPEAVEVVVVTKTRTADEVAAALRAGVTDVGENRVQEADAKRQLVEAPARWHLVGQLQRNKAGRAVETFDMVQSVDSPRLADALDRRAGEAERTVEVLVQVNSAQADNQGGVGPADLPALVDHLAALENLKMRGLMTIAAHSDDQEAVRACFRRLGELATSIESQGPSEVDMSVLSMGMSGDYELAIEEGSTMIRVGTAVFGQRG